MTLSLFSTMLLAMTRGRLIALLIFAASAIFAGLILSDLWPGLRGPAPGTSEWYWFYEPRPFLRWLPAVVVAFAFLLFAGWWLSQSSESRWPLAVLLLLVIALQVALIYADRPIVGSELVDRTLSKATNGYLATAGEIDDLGAALRDYPALMMVFDNEHAQTHPPGLIVGHWLTDHALRLVPELADWLAAPVRYWRCTDLWVMARPTATSAGLLIWSWIPVLSAALTVLPGYALARRWYDARGARLGTLLLAAIPSLLIFAPSPDQIFAFLALLSLYLLLVGNEESRPVLIAVSGLIVSVMSFLSLGNAIWFALLAAYLAITLLWSKSGLSPFWRRPAWWLAPLLLTIGAGSVWLVYWVGWGVAPWTIAQVGLDRHYELVTNLRRYDWWLVYNPLDFLLFAGLPVVVGFLWYTARTLLHSLERSKPEGRLALLLIVLLVVLTLLGTTRGEVGRLWMLFMPLAALLAAGQLAGELRQSGQVLSVLAAQLLLALSLGLAWRPFYAVILPVEKPEAASAVIRGDVASLGADFTAPDGLSIGLEGVVSELETDSLGLTLRWQAEGPTLAPYTVFVQLLDQSGAIVSQRDGWPVDGQWPTTCWQPGELVTDSYRLEVPQLFEPRDYSLIVGLYNAQTGARLPTEGGGDFVTLPLPGPD